MCDGMENVVMISEMKPVVHGKWVKEEDRDNHWHCSVCGFVEGWRCKFERYCPMCGAKLLDSEEES